MTKRLHAGHAAQAGVLAGLLARRGFTGSQDVLEVPFGGFITTLTEDADLALLTQDLGEVWETALVDTRFTQPAPARTPSSTGSIP